MVAYFDHNATTRVHPGVFEAMQPFLENKYGNPSSLYRLGVQASYAVEKARIQVARLIGAREEDIVFTSAGTESYNQALIGLVLATGKKHIVASSLEHPAVLNTCRFLQERMQVRINYAPVDRQGFVDPADVEAAIGADTALICFPYPAIKCTDRRARARSLSVRAFLSFPGCRAAARKAGAAAVRKTSPPSWDWGKRRS